MKLGLHCLFLLFWSAASGAQSEADIPLKALRGVAQHSALLSDDAFLPELRRDALQGKDPERRDCTEEEALHRWQQWSVSPTSTELLLCKSDHSIAINLYPARRGGYLVILQSIDGVHHQTIDFEYFWVDQSLNYRSEEKNKERLGIFTAHWNDFVDEPKFKPEENYPALMFIDESGKIKMEPWTWMEPSWDKRTPSKEIYYSWNGERFLRKVISNR